MSRTFFLPITGVREREGNFFLGIRVLVSSLKHSLLLAELGWDGTLKQGSILRENNGIEEICVPYGNSIQEEVS